MKAIIFEKFGNLDEFHQAEVTKPTFKAAEVLIRVKATSINVIDSRVRDGKLGPLVNKKFPKIPGADFAGIVEAIGSDVKGVMVGDEVYGATDPFKGGALSEFVTVPENQIAKKPSSLSFEEAASLPVVSLAALISLRDLGQIKAGEKALIHGASGGLGLSAIQLAKNFGAHVTAVVGTSGVAIAKSYGADEIIDYQKQDGTHLDRKFDVIINASGKMPFSIGQGLLKDGGKFIEPSPTIPVFIGSKIANLFRSKKHLMLQTMPKRQDLDYLSTQISEGHFKSTVAQSYTFGDYKKAFGQMEKGGVIGKIVVKI